MLTPLTSVAVVCRLDPRVGAISGVVKTIDSFIGPNAKWTVATVCKADLPGELRLLRRLAAREDPDMDPLLKRKRFSNALDLAIERDNFEVVKWLVEEYLPRGRIRRELESAASRGQSRTIRWLWEHHRSRVVWTSILVYFAATNGHLELAKWLHAETGLEGQEAKDEIKSSAIYRGDVAMLEWAIELGAQICAYDIDDAARLGHVDVLKWIASVKSVRLNQPFVGSAGHGGHLEVAKWFAEQPGINLTVSGCSLQYGSAPLVRWALANLQVKDKESLARGIYDAACPNDIELVKILHENSHGGSCTADTMDEAAKAGHLEMVKWLHDYRSEGCTTQAMDGAASGGHLDVIEWLHENCSDGCTTRGMDGAAEHGHLDIVKWLHNNRRGARLPPWTSQLSVATSR